MTTFSLADFFARHFADLGPEEFIETRAFPKGAPVSRAWHPDAASAARAALTYPPEVDVYFGNSARRKGGGEKKHVTKVRALHADLDFKCFADGRAGALAALNAFPLPPTVVVDSGNGFHAYWYLRAPVDPSAAIEALLKRLYLRLGATAIKPLDGVQDLSRIMRVPGTFNNKSAPPKPAQVRHTEYEAVYTLADFERLLPAPVEAERGAWSPPSSAGGARPSFSDIPSIAELREIMRHIPPGGDYTADWLRFLAAVHSIYPGPEGVALCEEWCPGKPGEIARKFASFKRDSRAVDATGVGTLVYTAKLHGYEPARSARAGAKFSAASPPPDQDPLNVLEMATALDAARREIADLQERLGHCGKERERLVAENLSLRDEVAAYKAAAVYPDSTIGGTAWDIARAAFTERERGNVLVEDGKEKARVCFKTAANERSATTLSNATRKNIAANVVDITVRKVAIETEAFKGEVDAAYYEIPPQCDTPAKFVLHLLSKPGEKRHGGARRRVDFPEFGEPVAGPVRVVTEKKRIWSSVAAQKTLHVETLDSHTEHFDEHGYQMTAAEVDTFKESIGLKPKPPAYRPTVQLNLTPEDIELTTIPRADLDDDPRRPVPLYGHCAQPGCALPALKGGPLCARHAAVHGYSMTGAD